MDPIIELLKEMRGRVPMYVGSNSIIKLAMFLRGYSYALEKHGLSLGTNLLFAIQELVQTKFEVRISKTWEEILLFHSIDDDEALETFWLMIDESFGDEQMKAKTGK